MFVRISAPSTLLALVLAPALGAVVGCYSASFDENQADVYYCVGDSDCLSSQACAQFRCVSDTGPQVRLTLPEPLTLVKDASLTVDFSTTEFTLSDSNEAIEGQGKILVSIDSGLIEQHVVTEGALVDISTLGPGPHRIEITAVKGDGTPYTNPSASDYTAFFIDSDNPDRPQVAIVYPPPGHVHVVGEPLSLRVAVRNFDLVDAGNDCKVDTDCDPFDDEDATCVPGCEFPPAGHAHIYLEADYPGCLLDTPIGCNGDYVLSMRTSDVNGAGNEVTGELEAKHFESAGTMLLSVGLQYNDHDPYPAKSFVIHDSIEISVIER